MNLQAPRQLRVSYAIPKRHAKADIRAVARRDMARRLAEELLNKEVRVTVDDYCETHTMEVYVLTASELQRLVDDRVNRCHTGMPYYHS